MRAWPVAVFLFLLSLSIVIGLTGIAAPGNDDFPGATIAGAAVSTTGTNTAGTAEAGEPNPAGVSGPASIWFSWVVVNTGTATIDTFGSDFDTTLGVYTGASVGALTVVAEDNDANASQQSKVSFAVTAGTTYQIQVNGAGGATGAVKLSIFNSSITPQGITAGGIPGGDIGDLYFDPNDADVVFAAVTGSGLFRSNDAGGNWTQIFLPTVANHTTRRLLVSKNVPNLVFVTDQLAGVEHTIARSADGGASVTGVLQRSVGRATALAEGTAAGTYFAGLTTDPSAGSVPSLFKSTDSGVTWNAVSAVGNSGFDIWDIFQLPTGRIVVGTGPIQGGGSASLAAGAIYYSDNGGDTWTSVGSAEATIGFAYNGADLLVAATTDEQSTFISTSADGQTWALKSTTFTNPGTGSSNFANRSPVYHAASDTFFVLTVSKSLLQSGTGPGYAWPAENAGSDKTAGLRSPVVYDLTGNRCFAIKPGDVNTIIMGANGGGDGIFTTTNGGASWAITNSGLNAQGLVLATKSLSAGHRYAAADSGFIYFSASELDGFTKIYRPSVIFDSPRTLVFDVADPRRVAVSVGNPSDVAGSTSFRLLLNSDVTATVEDVPPFAHAGWTVVTNPTTPSELIGSVLVNGSSMLAGIIPKDNAASGNYLFQSTNSGSSWTPVTSLTTVGGVRTLAFDPTNPNVIYAGAGDLGGFAGGGVLYPLHADGVYKSIDAGATWAHLDSDAMLNGQSPRKFVIDRDDPQRIWVQADPIGVPTDGVDNHIWESLDGGSTWTEIGPLWQFGNNPRGGLALTYLSGQDLLILAAGNGVLGQTPGTGSTTWLTGPDLYGDVRALYEGSLGAGTSSGLYEAATVVFGEGPGETGGKKGGCGCDLTAGGAGLGTLVAGLPLLLLAMRRRRDRRAF